MVLEGLGGQVGLVEHCSAMKDFEELKASHYWTFRSITFRKTEYRGRGVFLFLVVPCCMICLIYTYFI